ncbi:MAG TPA: TonB-dependent receptor [Bacteroidales bacterium]|nr:TonB-dependent receptor [Bacteroidales bacterium]
MKYFNFRSIYNRYLMVSLTIFMFVVLLVPSATANVNGTILDNKGNLLSGVIITIQESTVTTRSSEAGEFSIAAVPGDNLTFSHIGYQTVSTVVGPNVTKMNVTMQELKFGDREEDVVPIAYSSRNKRDLTSAISTTNFDDFGKRKDMNAMNGLGGLINGLAVISSGWSDTGLGINYIVRGLKTTNQNAPLILVDDIERTFDQLNLNEIESVSVLKDAGALAIYGNRGANGVVLVKTRRGKINKRDIIINAQMGMAQSLRLPKVLNAYDYSRLYNEAQVLDGVVPENLKYKEADIAGYYDVVNGIEGANAYKYPNVDFYTEFLKPLVKQQQYDLTMTGGNETAKYFVLLGYMNQEGAYKYGDNTFFRYNFRSNVDVKLNSRLDVSMDMSGRLENQTTPGGHYSYELFGEFAKTPTNAYPIFNENGSLGGTDTYKLNPYGLMNRTGQRDQTNRYFNADVQFRLDLSDVLKGLSWKGKGGIDFKDGMIVQLTSSQFAVYQQLADGMYTSNGTQDLAKTTNFWYNGKDRQFTFQTSFNYDRTWKDNRINALTMFYLRELNSSGVAVPYKTVGFASQVSYAFKDRYLLDGTASYTGSENFARGHRFGLFPAISAGWIVSEEDFLKDNVILSFLKLRLSYGATGLERPLNDRFLFRENWGNVSGYAFGTSGTGRIGTDQTRVGNDNLRWETSYKSDIGLDFGFIDNMLSWTIDGFYDNRKDILVQKYATTPGMAGLPLPYENGGETKSWGFDSELTFDKQINKSLRVTLKGNVMLTRSKILNISESFKQYAYQYQAGNPIGQPFGYTSNGFFTQEEIVRRNEGNLTQEEIDKDYDVEQNGGNLRAGDIRYVDVNNDNKIDWNDAKPIAGSSIPNLIGGLNLSVKYKLIDFSAQLMGMADRYIYMPGVYRNSFNGGGNASVYAFKAWTPETAETAIYPRLSINNNSNNQQWSDFWFRNGSFVKLKTIEIGYNLPASVLKIVKISKIRTYVNGYNLLSFDYVKDFDPEDTEAGMSHYPMQRIITVGMNVTF